MEPQEVTPRVVRFGAFELDRRAGELRKDGLRVRLQEQPLRILEALLAEPGQPVTREALRARLWPEETFVDFDSGLNRAINRLRSALGDEADNPRFIETLERRGYRFIAPVVAPPPPPSPVPAGEGAAAPGLAARIGYRWVGLTLLAMLAAATVLVWRPTLPRPAFGPPTAPIGSLAVLPLANLSSDPAQEYFSDGMTDALITQLASLPGMRVISRQSVMRYKGSSRPLPEIARELGVDAVIEGSVVRAGDRVRVTAQLIHASTDGHLWARSYDRPVTDVLGLQADIARAVAAQVRRTLGSPATNRVAAGVDPRAYELYLQGRFHVHELSPASLDRAAEYFRQSLALDAGFAPAHAGLARARFMREFWGEGRFRLHEPEVRAAVDRALALDPGLADARDMLGRVRLHYDWDWAGAEAEFRRAIAAEPSLADAHIGYSLLLQALLRFEEAVAEAETAVALDPRSPMAITEAGRVLYRARRYPEAEEHYLRALALDPGFGSALDRLVQLYLAQGRLAEARQALERLERLPSHRARARASLRARLEAASGNAAAARRLLAEVKSSVTGALPVAVYIALGDQDLALSELERYRDRRLLLPYSLSNPELDPLRAHPRFARLVESMGLPMLPYVSERQSHSIGP
jgi:TolB-like protein/DNA-binding winged helix-turn-helix (wHTH) protein/Tfp pilus assembly protein PilF